jgi:hypothetical protein
MELTVIELSKLAAWAEEKQNEIPAAKAYWSLIEARPHIDECMNQYLLVSSASLGIFHELVDTWEDAREELGHECLEIMKQNPA